MRREEILASNLPSYVKAKVLTGVPLFSEGKAEATITRRDCGSCININFDFRKGYILASLLAIAIFLVSILFSLTNFAPDNYYESSGIFLVVLLLFAVVIALEGYNVSFTKMRLIDELRLKNESKFELASPLYLTHKRT